MTGCSWWSRRTSCESWTGHLVVSVLNDVVNFDVHCKFSFRSLPLPCFISLEAWHISFALSFLGGLEILYHPVAPKTASCRATARGRLCGYLHLQRSKFQSAHWSLINMHSLPITFEAPVQIPLVLHISIIWVPVFSLSLFALDVFTYPLYPSVFD